MFNRKRFVALVAVPMAAAIAGAILYLNGGRYVETDNAYLKADIIPLSSEISAVIDQVHVRENQHISAGDVIVSLDTGPLKLELQGAQSRLAEVSAELRALKAEYVEQEAMVTMAISDHEFALRSLKRQKDLEGKNFVSDFTLDDLQHTVDVTQQKILASKLELQRIGAQLGGPEHPITQHPRFLSAHAEVEKIQLDIGRAKICAPVSGTVSQLPSAGQYLRAGNYSLTLVTTNRPWVEANFPERDLTHVREGQRVSFVLDIYPDLVWEGEVQSLSPATGSEFSIIPVQNATGNFVKIPQRIPVRISFDPNQHDVPLRAGLSVVAEIDTEHQRTLLNP